MQPKKKRMIDHAKVDKEQHKPDSCIFNQAISGTDMLHSNYVHDYFNIKSITIILF